MTNYSCFKTSSDYVLIRIDGRFFVIDESASSSCSFKRKDSVCINGVCYPLANNTFAGKRFIDTAVGHSVDGFLCRDILNAAGYCGLNLETRCAVFASPEAERRAA